MSYIDEASLLNLLRQNPAPPESDLSHSIQTIMDELGKAVSGTENVVGLQPWKNGARYTLELDTWHDYGPFGSKNLEYRNSICDRTYKRGDIMRIEFGHMGIGREQAFTHMAIVIADFAGLLVAVPIQSDRNQPFLQDTSHAILPMPATDHAFLKHDSLALVHQMRVVSKNRIYQPIFKTVTPKKVVYSILQHPFMETLERKIIQLYTPYVKKLYTEEISLKNEEIKTLNQQIVEREALMVAKDKEISELRTQLETYLKETSKIQSAATKSE